MNVEKGFIFFYSILFVAGIGYIGLMLLQHLFIYQKLEKNSAIVQQEFYNLESFAQKLFSNPFNFTMQCRDASRDYNQLLLHVWKKGCRQAKYTYLFSDLGVYPCLHVIKQGKEFPTHHWLVTVADKKNQVIQLRVAFGSQGTQCTSNDLQVISEGVQSWIFVVS